MANEHTLIVETSPPIQFTVADGTGIEKGTALKVTDPMTAAAAAENDSVAGIAGAEKIANDGVTKLKVYRSGIFKATAAGAITVGDALALSGSNTVKKAAAANVASDILGCALETAADGETFLYELRPGFNNNAYA